MLAATICKYEHNINPSSVETLKELQTNLKKAFEVYSHLNTANISSVVAARSGYYSEHSNMVAAFAKLYK